MCAMDFVDVVLRGATSFTGRLAAAYLAQHGDAFTSTAPGVTPDGLTYGLAGRNRAKLEAVKEEMGCAESVPIFVAEAADQTAVDAVVSQARVICSHAGPFVLHGSRVVDACCRMGVHYVDITLEVAWVRDMMERHERAAQESGAMIVPTCGFDSIPSDLGTLFAVEECRWRAAQERAQQPEAHGQQVRAYHPLPPPPGQVPSALLCAREVTDRPTACAAGGSTDVSIRRVSCVHAVSSPGVSGGAIASFIQMDNQPVSEPRHCRKSRVSLFQSQHCRKSRVPVFAVAHAAGVGRHI